MNPWKDLKDSFIPHNDNDYKPHFFRVKAMLAVGALIAVVGLGALLLQKVILENTDYLAAVIASAVVQLTNEDRAENELLSLKTNPILERAAQLKADDMAAKGYFAHVSPDGTTPWFWFKEAGYNFVYAGENLAVRFYDSVDVVKAWMNSPGHRANILNTHFTEIGIGIAEGTYQGTPTVFVVQMFGTPATDWSPFPEQVVKKPVPEPNASAPVAEVPPTTTVVAGSSTEEEPAEGAAEEPKVPEVVLEEESFVVVSNEMATNSPLAAVAEENMTYTLTQKLMTSPKSVTQSVYIVLATIIGIALTLMIVIEVRRQHPKNVALGVLLLVLMAGLLYLSEFFFPGTLTVL